MSASKPDLKALISANAQRWARVRSTRDFTIPAKRLDAAKARYLTVSAKTGVPWFVISVIHWRESSQSWLDSLAQGDPWNKVSTHIPAGRGPFQSWEDAAVDALVNCAPYASRWTDWSAGGTLTLLEQYNGLGYSNRGVPSPYIWAGTDQYVSGKYVRDGIYDPDVVDQQSGCAGILKAMMVLDPTITFTGLKITTSTLSTVPPSITNPAKPSLVETILNFVKAIFGGKK